MDETCLTSGIDVDSMKKLPTEDVKCEIFNVTDFQNELLDYKVNVDIGKIVSFS